MHPPLWPAVIPIDEVHLETRRGSRRISVLRLDTIHPLTGGNNWFKLKESDIFIPGIIALF
ncbi:MAG: hypothetical protein IPM91_07325 [Bacteroidetes bacterium]|nr:hypothetical protein [Bacteroidota bacterium]